MSERELIMIEDAKGLHPEDWYMVRYMIEQVESQEAVNELVKIMGRLRCECNRRRVYDNPFED